ncbi:hypothetical protein D3C87_1426290 [compost metagenome]
MANPTNVDHILPHRIADRSRIITGLDQFDAGCVFQCGVDFRQVDFARGLQGHAIAIAKKHRGLNASDGYFQRRQRHDLPQLSHQAFFQQGMALLVRLADLCQQVEGHLPIKELRLQRTHIE